MQRPTLTEDGLVERLRQVAEVLQYDPKRLGMQVLEPLEIACRQGAFIAGLVVDGAVRWDFDTTSTASTHRWLMRLKLQSDDDLSDEETARAFADIVVWLVDKLEPHEIRRAQEDAA